MASELSILVVDDDQFSLELTHCGLERIGYKKTTTSSSGPLALDQVVKNGEVFDIIILDLNMPDMDGVQFMRHLNGEEFNGGIILLSGEDKRMLETALSLARVHKLNILGALSKPFNPASLNGMLSSYVPHARSNGHAPQRSITLEELQSGIEGSSDNEVALVFQPKVCVKTGAIVSVETLARWRNSERGLLGPPAFIPLAEESGLIDALSLQIYKQAIMQSGEWSRQSRELICAVNFSVNSFSSPAFCESIVNLTEQYGVNSNRVILEITETQTMAIPIDCLEALMGLRLKRFNLSIDDFGTGNSSMAQLKNIPFTELKIDRAFVTGASHDSSALAILETSIELARRMDMQIVAEGAETREDWDLVERLGCDYVQGFYCAKPMSHADLMGFLDRWTGPH